MSRTTIILDPVLEKKLRETARKEGKTLTMMIQSFIREGLNRMLPRRRTPKISLPAFSMGRPVVDPADRGRLWDLMDEKIAP